MIIENHKQAPWWLLPHILGVDVAAAAFVYGCACADFMRVQILGSGALVLLSVATWVCVMLYRLCCALRGGSNGYAWYYRRHVSWLLPLLLSAIIAASWMSFFYVGQGLLIYVPYVLWPLMGAVFFPGVIIRSFTLAMAFVAACYSPGLFYTIQSYPVDMFFSAQYWALTGIVFLFLVHRIAKSQRWNPFLSIGCTVAFIWLLILLWKAAPATKGFTCFLITVVACLHVLRFRLRSFGTVVNDVVDWFAFALCALLAILVFAPGSV